MIVILKAKRGRTLETCMRSELSEVNVVRVVVIPSQNTIHLTQD